MFGELEAARRRAPGRLVRQLLGQSVKTLMTLTLLIVAGALALLGLRDAWFVGYTPDLAVGVWVGADDGRPVGVTGAQTALPIWATVMRAAVRRARPRAFQPPPGVVMVPVERSTGQPAYGWCEYEPTAPIAEAFRLGSEPDPVCVESAPAPPPAAPLAAD
jgi:membrane peptidoglycan carboxypeptidase